MCVQSDACPLARALRQDSEPLPQKSGCPVSTTSAIGPEVGESELESFKSCFSDRCSHVGLMDASPVGFHSQTFWGLISKVQVLNVRGALCEVQTLLLREKLQVLGSLPTVGRSTGAGVYDKIVSQPLLPASMWVFSHSPAVQELLSQFLVFLFVCLFFSPEKVVSYEAIDSVCLWKEVSSVSFYSTIVNCNPQSSKFCYNKCWTLNKPESWLYLLLFVQIEKNS